MLLLLLLTLVLAQDPLDAYVKVLDNNDSAGNTGVYRFTVQVDSATVIQTLLPKELTLLGNQISVCRYYQVSSTTPISDCTYDAATTMVQFTLPVGFSGYLVYDIGNIKNPSYSVLLTDFTIQTLDSRGNIVCQSQPYAVYVQITQNVITNQNLVVDSLQIAALTTYIFSMQVTNPVQAQGFVQITFPTTQIPVPVTAPPAYYSLTAGATWISAPVTATTTTALVLGISNQILAQSQIMIKLLNINNPNTMNQTQSFIVQTVTPQGHFIDQVLTGLSVVCSVPAVLQIDQISVSNRRVGAISSITFKVTLPTKYSAGGYMIVQLPPTVQVSSLQCLLLIGFNDDSGFCQALSPTQIKLYDIINQQSLVFAVQGLQNPANTATTGNFTVTAYDPQSNLIAVTQITQNNGFTPTPGTLSSASSTRSVNIVGNTTNDVVMFTLQNPVQTGQIISIQIPSSHFILPQAIKCSLQTTYNNTPTSIPCTLSQNNISLPITCPSTCQSGTVVMVTLSLLQNLPYIQSNTDSVYVQTLTADFLNQIDMTKSDVYTLPLLTEGLFTNASFVKVVGVVGAATSFEFHVISQNIIPARGFLKIELPDQSFKQSQLACQTPCSFTTYTSGYVQLISLQPCQLLCPAQSLFNFTISGLINPQSTKPITNQFTFRSYTGSLQAIDKLVFTQASGLAISPAQFTSIQLSTPVGTIVTGDYVQYSVLVTPNNGLQSTGSLQLYFPVTTASSCQAFDQQSLRTLSCSVSSNTLTVSHSNSQYTYVNSTIVVQVMAYNPPSTQQSTFATVQSFLQGYLVDQSLQAWQVQANTPNSLQANVTRSNYTVDSQTVLTVCIAGHNPYNTVIITIPTTQAVFTSVTVSSPFTQQAQQLTVTTSQRCFTVSGVINPSTTIPSQESITVTTTQGVYLVDQLTSNLFAQPLLSAGPFVSASITSSSYSMQSETTLSISTQSNTQANTLKITVQPGLFYQSPNTVGGTYTINSLGSTVTSLEAPYQPSLQFKVLNKYDTVPSTTIIQIQSFSQGYMINSQQVSLFLTYQPNTAHFTVARTIATTQTATDIVITLSPATIAQPQTMLIIYIPSFWFSNPVNVGTQSPSQIQANTTHYTITTVYEQKFTISGFSNRYSTDTQSDYISLQSVYNNYPVDIYPAQPFQSPLISKPILISMSLSNNMVGGNSSLDISISSNGRADIGDVLMITGATNLIYDRAFVEGSQSPINLTQYSTQLNQQFTGAMVIKVVSLFNLKRAEIMYANLSVQIMSQQGGLVVNGSGTVKQQLQPLNFVEAEIVRNNVNPGVNVQLSVMWVLDIVLMTGSLVQITIPGLTLSGEPCMTNIGPCVIQGSAITFSADVSPVIITNGIKNPSEVVIQSQSCQITITNQQYQVATQSTNLFIVPPLQSSTTIEGSISQTGLEAGQLTKLSITFTTNQTGSILLSIPNGVYITGNPICTINQIATQCVIVQESSNIRGLPIFVMQLSVKVPSVTSTNILVVNGLSNTDIPSFMQNKQITMQLVNQSKVLASCLLSLQPITTPTFMPALMRQDTQPGLSKVKYILSFKSTTYIRSQDYFILSLPYDQAVTSSMSLSCSDQGQPVQCRYSKDLTTQYITIKQWCNGLCSPSKQLTLVIYLQNPNQLVPSNSCQLTLYSIQNEQLAQSPQFQVSPLLDGLSITMPSLKRVANILGVSDSLQLYISSLSMSIITQTDLIIDLPDLLVYGRAATDRGQVLQSSYQSGAVKQIQIVSVCSQSLLCIAYQSMTIVITGLINPMTNLVNNQTVKYTFKQNNVEVGLVTFQAGMGLMKPPHTTISFQGQCYTSQPCQIAVSIKSVNQVSDYLEFTSQIPFLSCTNCLQINLNKLRYYGKGHNIQFQLLQLQTPSSATSLLSQFSATSYETINRQSSVLELFTTNQTLIILPSPFVNITIRRTNAVLGAVSDIRVFMQTKYPNQGDQIQLIIPLSEAILNNTVCVAYSTGLPLACQITNQVITLQGCAQSSCVVVLQNVLNPKTVQQAQQAQATLYQGATIVYQSQVLITPALTPSVLLISSAIYTPSRTVYKQPIQLSFQFQSDFEGNYLSVAFSQFTPSTTSLIIQVNGEKVQIVDTSPLVFSLQHAVANSVVIDGLEASMVGTLQTTLEIILLKQFGNIIAMNTQIVAITVQPSQISPITAYLSNPYVNQTTYLYLSSKTPGTSVLSSSLQFKSVSCTDLSLIAVQCSVSNNKIVWQGDSVIIGPFQTTIAQTEVFTIQGVINDIVAVGSFQLQVWQGGSCTSHACKQCTSTQQCTSCNPGYVLDSGACVLICSDNEFAAQGYCFQCDYSCMQCQQQASCTICSGLMVGGQCFSECPSNYYEDERECVYNATKPAIDCATQLYKEYNSTSLECTKQAVVCSDQLCDDCGYDPGYCDKCKTGMVGLNGKCVKNCPAGFFEYRQTCYVCNPTCQQCQGNANTCLGCQPGLFFTEGYSICVDECPTGTYMAMSQCAQCDYSCNSCSSQQVCTSCFKQFKTDIDLYLNGNVCVAKCPFGMTTSYIQHECYHGVSVLQWTLPLLLAALVTVFAVTIVSRCFGKKIDRKYWVASALLNLIDFVNRVVLAALLWGTNEVGGFTVTGVYALGCSVAGIYESQIVPIGGRPNSYGLLASVTGPYSTRLLLGNPFGKYKTITERHNVPWTQFENCCTVQSVLTLMQLINSIVVFTRFGFDEAVFGFAVNSLVICAVQLWLQLMVKHCDRRQVVKHYD